jgi:6-phosphogluconolactonase
MTMALSGGSTPRHMHEILAQRPHVDWSKVHVFWGDERTVPPDHEESNFRMAKESLLERVSVPNDHIHRMAGEKDPDVAAKEYEQTISQVFGVRPPEIPRFDVILLGMGADGHTASLFPGTDALDERERYVVANHVPQQNTDRLTLTFPVLNAARLVIFMVAGADKADAVQQCLSGEQAIHPAARVQPTDGQCRWLLDAEAAARLTTGH